MLAVADDDDRSLGFIAGLLTYHVERGRLTEKQCGAANKVWGA
jgi:hypothetical protein